MNYILNWVKPWGWGPGEIFLAIALGIFALIVLVVIIVFFKKE